MNVTRKLNRRSFMGQVTGGVAAGALGLFGGEARAWQPPYTGITDTDSGSTSDGPGYGRGGAEAVSDNDSGPRADPGGQGRNARNRGQPPATGVTDRDGGPNADARGRGRGATTGFSDRDRGANADLSGRGRGTVRSGPYSGYSDNDSGEIHDAPGHGAGGPTRYTGLTDSDSVDRGGYGLGPNRRPSEVRGYQRRRSGQCLRYSGSSDRDAGAARDPAGYGHENGNNVVESYFCR